MMKFPLLLRSVVGVGAAACLAAPSAHAATLATGDPAGAFTISVLADGLSQPTDMAELPDGRVVITQRLGDVVVVTTDGNQVDSGHINVYPEFGEQGLLGVVADPDFATNKTLYFYASAGTTTEDPVNKHKVYRITLGDDSKIATTRDTVIDMGLRASRQSVDGGASNHNGGGLLIYKGQLYLSVGDTGHNATPPTNRLTTCLNHTNGKILRVNLDGTIPTNPLSAETAVTGCVNSSGASTIDDWDGRKNSTNPYQDQPPEKRVFAWGLRNPYRFWIDPQTSRLWIGDVGESTREEVSVGSPIDNDGAGSKGEDFGWPFFEGTTAYSTSQEAYQPTNGCMGLKPARACVPSVYDYGHSSGNNCVIGGIIPDGCGWAAPWTSRYFFGDNGSGSIWTLDVNANRDGVVSGSVKDFAKSQGIGSFRMGAAGVLYIAEVSGGSVDKITPKGLDPTMCATGAGGSGSGGMSAGGATSAGGTSSAGTSSGTSGGAPNANGGTTSASGGTGTGVAGGTAGGGRTGSGGASTGTAGRASGSGGVPSSAGGSTSAGTSSGAKGGTATTSGGTSSTAGKAAGGADGADDKGGCGCRVAGQESGGGSLLAMSALLGVLARRRRRSAVSH